MSEIKSRIRRIEERIGKLAGHDEIDWPALLAHVARHGKQLVDLGRGD